MNPDDVLRWYDAFARGGFPVALFVIVVAFVRGWLPTPRERELLERRVTFLEGDNRWLRDSLLQSLGLVTRFSTAALASPPVSSIIPPSPSGG